MKSFVANNLDVTDAIVLRMTDGYGIATNYRCKNECPYDGSKIVVSGGKTGCFDGEWTHIDSFTCEKGCLIQYRDMRKANGYDE